MEHQNHTPASSRHQHTTKAEQPANWRLAMSATIHCLIGCGIGEIAGIIIGSALALSMLSTIWLGIVLGFVAGFLLGMRPFVNAGFSVREAFKTVAITEGLSIVVMETAEVLTQWFIPGVMMAGLGKPLFWIGMAISLAAGFLAAFPVNLILVKRGIRHQH